MPPRRFTVPALVALLTGLLCPPGRCQQQGGPPSTEPAELEARAFDAEVALRVVPFESAAATRDALAAALEEINTVQALSWVEGGDQFVDPGQGGAAALNRLAGEGWVAVDPRLAELLSRALAFCAWSNNALGPLAGRLNELWGIPADPQRSVTVPPPTAVSVAVQAARCDGLEVDRAAHRARLQAGRRIDLWGFARGFAVDRGVATLQEHGAMAGTVRIGRVLRAFGSAPGEQGGAQGWPVAVDPSPDARSPTERIVLLDQSVAMASSWVEPIRIGDTRLPPYVNQRDGQPPRAALAVLDVTELAVDAEALASSLFVIDQREGQLLLGGLTPEPAVKWFMGREGPPLESERSWASLPNWGQP